jgi:hypothetical protein
MSVIDGRYAYIVYVDAELITWARDEVETWPNAIRVDSIADTHDDALRVLDEVHGWVAVPVRVADQIALFDGMDEEEGEQEEEPL